MVRMRPHEPVYGGKSLSYWLRSYATIQTGGMTGRGRALAEDALHHIGTNAIPTLLRLLQAKNYPLTIKLDALIKKQHFVKSPFWLADDKNIEAALGFQVLGAEAKSAAPELINIFEANISVMSRTGSRQLLGECPCRPEPGGESVCQKTE